MSIKSLLGLFDQFGAIMCVVNAKHQIVFTNQMFTDRFSQLNSELIGSQVAELFSADCSVVLTNIDNTFQSQQAVTFFYQGSLASYHNGAMTQASSFPNSASEKGTLHIELTPFAEQNQKYLCVTIKESGQNLTSSILDLNCEHLDDDICTFKAQNAQLQNQLIQSEKMASIGQLAAGLVHEINNPIGFISSNLNTLDDYFKTLNRYLDKVYTIAASSDLPELKNALEQAKSEYQVDYLLDDIGDLISESLQGSTQVKSIIGNLKEFARTDDASWSYRSLAQGIDLTLKIIHNRVKYGIEIERNYDVNTPDICCQLNKLNQVFLNLLVNATQAIEDKGTISISLAPAGDDQVEIKVSDSGKGIDKESLSRIFTPFYTTKAVGKGTGLGLSISQQVVQEHRGRIQVESEVGVGTTFTMYLPVHRDNVN